MSEVPVVSDVSCGSDVIEPLISEASGLCGNLMGEAPYLSVGPPLVRAGTPIASRPWSPR